MMVESVQTIWQKKVSLWRIAVVYRAKVVITWLLLVLESVLDLLFPLAIGMAVDSLIDESFTGLSLLGGLSLAVLFVGAGRRFYDTRVYAGIFQELANSLVRHEKSRNTPTSSVTARVNLLYEVVEFLEDSLPMLLSSIIGFVGVTLLIGLIDYQIALLCLGASVLVVVVYAATSNRIFRYNEQQNNELEKQVAVLAQNNRRKVAVHLKRLMKWNIKLSDLETASFSAVWLVLGSLLLVSIVLIAGNADISYGQKITSIMYVFQYVEVVMSFPLYYQQFVRLTEITHRLSA